MVQEASNVLDVPDAMHTVLSLRVERETLVDICAQMLEAEEVTRELLALVTNSEGVQKDKGKKIPDQEVFQGPEFEFGCRRT